MEEDSPFKFTLLEHQLPTLCNKDFKVYLEKWYLIDRLRTWTFSFDKPFHHYLKDQFIQDFFRDNAVLNNMQGMSYTGSWGRIDKPSTITIEELRCTVTSMSFFDKLKEEGIVRDNGSICKCFDEFHEGITISDELRKMLLIEDSDNFEAYNDDERSELLFKLFTHLVVGGPICQYEDNLQPYLDVTKSLYKDLVCVQKKAGTKELEVASKVYKVQAKDEKGHVFYPGTDLHDQTFSYLIVDPVKRHVTLLYHCWGRGVW